MELEFLKYKDNVHLVSMLERPGSLALISSIEWFWFSPKKSLNHLINMAIVKWEDINWVVTSFPEHKLQDAKQLAKQLGMRIADGVPTIIRHVKPGENPDKKFSSEMGAFIFPGGIINGLDNKNMFTIENDSDSPIYANSERTNKDIMSAEKEIVTGFVNGVEWTPEKIVEYIYGIPNFVSNPKFTKE